MLMIQILNCVMTRPPYNLIVVYETLMRHLHLGVGLFLPITTVHQLNH